MIMDKLLEFADGVAFDDSGTPFGDASEGIERVGDVVDLQVARDIGQGNPLYVVIQVDTAFVGVNAVCNFKLLSDAGATIAEDGSATEHFQTGDIGVASLTAGAVVAVVPLPYNGVAAYERYLGIGIDTTTADLTAGAVSAFIVKDPSAWKAYAEGAN